MCIVEVNVISSEYTHVIHLSVNCTKISEKCWHQALLVSHSLSLKNIIKQWTNNFLIDYTCITTNNSLDNAVLASH